MSAVRGRPRKFDWDEAAKLRAEGWTYEKIAQTLGVSEIAVWYALNQKGRVRRDARTKAWIMSGVCPDCGKQGVTREGHGERGKGRCRACAARALAFVTDETARCGTCKRWLPHSEFSRNHMARKTIGGRRTICRACDTKARTNYRERHKVPCVHCGALCLPPSEKRTNGAPIARCRECFYAELRK